MFSVEDSNMIDDRRSRRYTVHHPVWSTLLNSSPATQISAGSKVKHALRHKYGVKHRLRQDCGYNFDLIIHDVRLQDAGKYKCLVDRALLYFLTVVERPACTPILSPGPSREATVRNDTPRGYFVENQDQQQKQQKDQQQQHQGLKCVVSFIEPMLRSGKFQPSISWRDMATGNRVTDKDGIVKSLHLDDYRTEVSLILQPGNGTSHPSGSTLQCVVSDPSLNVHPSTGKIHLHNAGLSAMGELSAGFRSSSPLSSLVSDSCEWRPVEVDCPEEVEIDLDLIKARLLRQEALHHKKVKEEMRKTGGDPDVITSPYHERCINKLRGTTIPPLQLKALTKHKMAVLCTVSGNPLPPTTAIRWETSNGTIDDEMTMVDALRGRGVTRAYYFLARHNLHQRDHNEFTVKFTVDTSNRTEATEEGSPFAEKGIVERVIPIRFRYGPYLLCPQHVFLSDHTKEQKRYSSKSTSKAEEIVEEEVAASEKGGSFNIKCVVQVHPALTVEDISWTLKPVSRERRKLVRVKPEDNAFNETVKVAHVSSPAGENVSLVDLAIMESWVRSKRSSSTKYLLDLTVEKNSKLATASIQIQWDGATRPDSWTFLFVCFVAVLAVAL